MLSLQIAIQSGHPIVLWGGPGTGKTTHLYGLFSALNYEFVQMVLSTRGPTDFSGQPYLNEQEHRIELLPIGDWVPTILRNAKEGKKTAVFMDEISTTPPAVQAAALKVIQEGIVGDVELPTDMVQFVAAANPPDEAANGWEFSAPMANRFIHLQWNPPVEDWIAGMISGWPLPQVTKLPKDWSKLLPQARTTVASFIQVRSVCLQQLPKEESRRGGAWASRRTWDIAASLLAACNSIHADKNTRLELFAGTVGEGTAIEFMSWLEALDLPDPEDLLLHPEKFVLPERADQAFACLSSVVSAVIGKNTPPRWEAAWKILVVAVNAGIPDLAAASARVLGSNRPSGARVPAEVSAFIPLLKAAGMLSREED